MEQDAIVDVEEDIYGEQQKTTPTREIMSPETSELPHSGTVSRLASPSCASATSETVDSTCSQSPTTTILSLDIADYNLPPPFPVPERYNTPFSRRKVITKILGGNTQKTYPVAADRRYPMYACPRMDSNPTIPRYQGHHGILITKPVPRELNKDNFVLFVKHLTESRWYYRGQYRIRHASHLTPAQWAQQPRKFRHEWTQWIVDNKDWGHRELNRLGLVVTFENAMRAIERGDIKWEVKVMECIGFDTELYRQLSALAGAH